MLSRLANSALDPRIHIFRRSLTNSGVGDLEVDAYVLATERFLIFCDTLLCPEDAAFMAAPFLQSWLDSTDTANSQPDRR